MSGTYPPVAAENTCASLLDGNFNTGAATCSSGEDWIKAIFPKPPCVTSITIAPLQEDTNVWEATNGSGGSVQYSNDDQTWTNCGNIEYVAMQKQKIEIGGVDARYWRLYCISYLGTSSFIFR
ncbi:unnamed protein product [Didymodactylos carnosus]|uniref:F5/8 type C domain-containing protein n=1 Tax=Didymodactylos carnosus TaxID=1234261 RepID=A0A8S2R5Y6_9BILA|nr:unnamed protein product [Didymodactylos carnosus]CAF4141246.1 unnamed protein product [Didymodactylos carnosus]